MSSCQKHKNHHCIHSHQCKDPSHKITHKNKSKINLNSKCAKINNKSLNTKSNSYLQVIEQNQECLYQYSNNHPNLTTEFNSQQIQKLTKQLDTVKKNSNITEIENRKLTQRNNHLQIQMEYLRSQLNILINNHNIDFKEQIKKHLKENTLLNLKIKQLSSTNLEQEKMIEELSTDKYSLLKKYQQAQSELNKLNQKLQIIIKTNSNLSHQKSNIKLTLKQTQKQFGAFKQKFNLLTATMNSSIKSNQLQVNKLLKENQNLNKSLYKTEDQLKKIQQIYNIDKKSDTKLINELKVTIKNNENVINEIKTGEQCLIQDLERAKDDLIHAKKIIIKYENITQQCKNIRTNFIQPHRNTQLEVKQIVNTQNATVNINQQFSWQKCSQEQVSTLRKQNIQLIQQINQLRNKMLIISNQNYQFDQQKLQNRTNQYLNVLTQPSNIIVNEEFILQIGASAQFKKIIQQKNVTIKQLIRQKTALYNQIYEKQLIKQ